LQYFLEKVLTHFKFLVWNTRSAEHVDVRFGATLHPNNSRTGF
jgi:hypothetical protein